MAGNDEARESKPPDPGPLSLDDAERLASHFTPLWEEEPEAAAGPLPDAPAPAASPLADLRPVEMAPPEPEPASEPTPAMVAIARPMGSSPDIDPNAIELPDRRSDYAPPRPLAVPQRTMVGLAPPPPVQVAPSATTTPLGLTSSPPTRPALEVVPEVRPALQVVAEPIAPSVGRAEMSSIDEFSVPPRKRKTGLVLGVMGVAAALVAAVGVRSLFVKQESSTPSPPQPARTAQVDQAAPRTTAPSTNRAAGEGVEPRAAAPSTAEPLAAPPASARASEPSPIASAVSGENSAVAAAPSPTTGVQLAATRQATDTPTAAAAESPKPRAPQRVEEAKHAARAPRPIQPRRPRTETTPKAPVSPPLPGGGAIVRQSPF